MSMRWEFEAMLTVEGYTHVPEVIVVVHQESRRGMLRRI